MSSPRYRHWIERANDGKWPSAIVCVDCESRVTDTAERRVGLVEHLHRWHATRLQSYDGRYVDAGVFSAVDYRALLLLLGSEAVCEPNLWIVSYQCNRIWSLLGLWKEIEDGRIQVCDSDYRNSQAYRQRVREYRMRQTDPLRPLSGEEESRLAKGFGGYIVCEDPPNILRGRLVGAGHPFTWVDVRNWGVEPPADMVPGMPTAQWLARLVSRMCELCRGNGLTALKATAASQAMSAWRHSYLTEGVYVHTDEAVVDIEGRGYIGGRCEASKIGYVTTPVWHLDFRSQYGWVCANCHLPTRLLDYREGGDLPAGHNADDATGVIVDCTVETDEPSYPLRRDGEVIYPIGRYRTVLCGPEYGDARAGNRIREVHAVATYEVGYPLRAYAERLYSMRCQADSGEVPGIEQWIKRLIVSLPGKLGQLNRRWTDCHDVMHQCMYGEWYAEDEDGQAIRYRSLAGIVQRDTVDGFAADSVPSMAAFITSHARMRLLSAIRLAGWCNVYYYDTDSLFVNRDGIDRLQHSEYMSNTGLGQLTLRSGPSQLEIRGVKYYVESGHVICSGLARGEIHDAGDGKTYVRHLSAVEQARRGRRPETVVVQGHYARLIDYHGGVVHPDGRVTPHVVRE